MKKGHQNAPFFEMIVIVPVEYTQQSFRNCILLDFIIISIKWNQISGRC
jgi:hypothetical protein